MMESAAAAAAAAHSQHLHLCHQGGVRICPLTGTMVYTFMLNDHVDLLEPFLASGQTFNPRFHIGGFRILCIYPHHQSDGFSTKMRALHLLFSQSPKKCLVST